MQFEWIAREYRKLVNIWPLTNDNILYIKACTAWCCTTCHITLQVELESVVLYNLVFKYVSNFEVYTTKALIYNKMNLCLVKGPNGGNICTQYSLVFHRVN